ncbi:SDR family NAD(P)-dependent oxidoreductase [Halosaccharopolyspora lacisalsi]|uniref:SDR family NAD(P)-dependent oxidoreductase n=1 Tax=Halosaccharopolyspora lacisalsi TaxID=1000566 RepID=UPI002E2C6334|nr:SDR family NAD(P)-dependent oxidoreductase [Halosaccharopolyspora lacisalsi]
MVEDLGGIDVLGNHAGAQGVETDFTQVAAQQFDRTFKTNVCGVFWLIRAVLPHLPAGDAIINTGSVNLACTRPSTTRVGKVGCGAIAGPWSTVPSESRKTLPCHEHSRHGELPPATTSSPDAAVPRRDYTGRPRRRGPRRHAGPGRGPRRPFA